MRVELALIAGLLSSSVIAYGNEGWGNAGPKAKTVTKVLTKYHTKTCTVTKTKAIMKTKVVTKVETVTVTATPTPEEDKDAVSPDLEPDMEGGDEEEGEEKPAKPAEKPAKVEDDEAEDEPKPEPAEEKPEPAEEEPAGDEPKPAPKTHVIKATLKDGKPIFDPNTLMASTGDTVKFEFHPINHSVARGTFDKPCIPLEEGGFFSGFFPVKAEDDEKPTFSIEVKDSNPIWFYCTAGKHCQNGMVGVINPGPDDDVKAYAAAAAKAPTNVSPKKANGGIAKRKRSLYLD
ncbi:hypothetical protein TWF281_006606 [Arthrobotrys megalospora]